METITKRDLLIQDYADWVQTLLASVNFKKEEDIVQAALIDAKYQELKSLQQQFEYSTGKSENARTIRDEELTKDLSKPILSSIQQDLEQTLEELKTELNELQTFDISEVKNITRQLMQQKQTLEYNLKLIDELNQNLEKEEANHIKDFNATSEYLKNRLQALDSSEKAVLQNKMLEQDAKIKEIRGHLFNIVRSKHSYLHQHNDKRIEQLSNWIARTSRLENLLTTMIERHQREIDSTQEILDLVNLKLKQEVIQSTEVIVPVKLTDHPVVIIFELTPPPSINLNQSYKQIQKEVFLKFRRFFWPPLQIPKESMCQKSEINLAQKLSYHYDQPFNNEVNVLLFQSVGSGKTATLRLISSTFARAGYDIMFVSPIALKNDLINEAFTSQSDFNVQQYTRGKTVEDAMFQELLQGSNVSREELKNILSSHVYENFARIKTMDDLETFPNAEPKPEILRENIKLFLLNVLKKMGLRQYPSLSESLTYQQLSNLAGRDVKSVRNFLEKTYFEERSGPQGDLLYKVFLGIDEAHNLVAVGSTLKDSEIPDFAQLRNMLWKSFKLSSPTHQSVRVCLLTATPVKNHPLDGINLISLTHIPDPALGFNEYDAIDPANRTKTEKRFMDNEWDFKLNKFKREEQIKEFVKGRISYLNYVGEVGIFPQPFLYVNGIKNQDPDKNPVQYIPVKLSLLQAGLVGECFQKEGLLHVKDSKMGELIVAKTGGTFTFDAKTNDLKVVKAMKGIKIGGGAAKTKKTANVAKKSEKIKVAKINSNKTNANKPSLSKCLAANVTFPWIQASTNFETHTALLNMSNEELKEKFIVEGSLRKYSPLFEALLNGVRKKNDHALQSLYNYYSNLDKQEDRGEIKRRENVENDMKNYKHFIFVDTTNDDLGVNLIGKFLSTFQGYEVLNDVKGLTKEIKRGKPYKGILILSKANKHFKNEILNYYNSNNNRDGRDSSIIILDGSMKEGVSLRGVRYIHIAGYIGNDADLKQAVARGIRTCSRQQTPFIPYSGWTTDISIYSPSFPADDPFYPLELVEMLKPENITIEIAKNEMIRLMKEAAYDKELLANINNASDASDNAVRLYATRK